MTHCLFQYQRGKANLRILEVKEIKSVPYTPLSHPFVERLIGTVRREYLDHTLFWNATDLTRKLADFQTYFNNHRIHSALDGNTPEEAVGGALDSQTTLNKFSWQEHCQGIYHRPTPA